MTAPATTLAVHPGALGDVVLFARVLERLEGATTLLAGDQKARMLAGLGLVERALGWEQLAIHRLFADPPAVDADLAEALGGHDRLISCLPADEPHQAMRWSACCGASRSSFLPIRPPAGFDGHLVELWFDWLGLGELDAASRGPWAVPRPWRQAARGWLDDHGLETARPLAVLHPGSGGAAKCWPIERFCELAERLAAEAGLDVVAVLGPVELETWPADRVERLTGAVKALWPAPSLSELAGLTAEAALYVGNDSGPTHLAAAVGAPTVALFAASDARHFAPLGPAVRVVHADGWEGLAAERVAAKSIALL